MNGAVVGDALLFLRQLYLSFFEFLGHVLDEVGSNVIIEILHFVAVRTTPST